MKIKIGIVGYGNVGKSVEKEIEKFSDMELVKIFTRRKIDEVGCNLEKIENLDNIGNFKGKIDVLIVCLGSANDLTKYIYNISKDFNTVDSYDTHSKICDYFKQINKINKKNNTVSAISIGWDPGIFSCCRVLSDSILPKSNVYTFWGEGVSQGHSEAIRRIKGVKKAIQYTIPIKESMDKILNNENSILKTRDKHTRLCFVVLDKDDESSRKNIEKKIKTMPNYFSDYDTTVKFITEEEFDKNHTKMSHGGNVITSGITGTNNNTNISLSLKLESNPEFTASVLLAYSRAVYRLHYEHKYGSYTILDIPISYISKKDEKFLLKNLI